MSRAKPVLCKASWESGYYNVVFANTIATINTMTFIGTMVSLTVNTPTIAGTAVNVFIDNGFNEEDYLMIWRVTDINGQKMEGATLLKVRDSSEEGPVLISHIP